MPDDPSSPDSSHSARYVVEVLLHRLLYFPSWSWAGWKSNSNEMTITVRHNSRFRNTFRALILIHAYTDTLILYLLTEPRFDHYGSYDSKGTEGYCTMAIADYNDVTKLDPLPLKSRLANDLPPPEFVGSISHLLVFWTHVARFTRDSMVIGRYCQLWSLQDGEDPYDVVLVGLEYPNVSSSTDEYFYISAIRVNRQ
jgi:hypothetical protein